MAPHPVEITRLLRQWGTGDRQGEDRLFELLLPGFAQGWRALFPRRAARPYTLQPTALVNEAFLRLAKIKNIEWQDRGHFLAVSARIMRRYLLDHARARPSVIFPLMEGLPERVLGSHTPLELAITVDTLLDELETESHQKRAVVELKFFLGLTDTEAADALNLTLHTLQREWYRSRRWLFERLSTQP